jgi:hypothetical protein
MVMMALALNGKRPELAKREYTNRSEIDKISSPKFIAYCSLHCFGV